MRRVVDLHPVDARVVRAEHARDTVDNCAGVQRGVAAGRLRRAEGDGPGLRDGFDCGEGRAGVSGVEETLVG